MFILKKRFIRHLVSFARSSVISRVSCRFMSSHWATVLSRQLFCSFSLRWACFSSATVLNRSLSPLKPNRQSIVNWQRQHPDLNRSETTYQEHWGLSEGAAWLWETEKSSPEKKFGSANLRMMRMRHFSEVISKLGQPTVCRHVTGVWPRYATFIYISAETQEESHRKCWLINDLISRAPFI